MRYISTRGGIDPLGFQDAVMMGLARDGGLLLPETLPTISAAMLDRWQNLPYQYLAREVLSLLLDKYIERGIVQFNALSDLMKVQPFDRFGSPSEIASRHFGGVKGLKEAVSLLQTAIYQ